MISEFLEMIKRTFTYTATVQEEKGIKKYRKPIDPMDDEWDWLQMAEEELVDGYKYLIAERKKRDEVLKEVLVKVEQMIEADEATRKFLADRIRENIWVVSRNNRLR